MKIKTSELQGAALDWVVATCENKSEWPIVMHRWLFEHNVHGEHHYSTDWSQGGPIIDREEIELHVIPEFRVPENWANCKPEDKWCANIWLQDEDLIKVSGPTLLVAAMRCYVASKLGDDVDVPETLL